MLQDLTAAAIVWLRWFLALYPLGLPADSRPHQEQGGLVLSGCLLQATAGWCPSWQRWFSPQERCRPPAVAVHTLRLDKQAPGALRPPRHDHWVALRSTIQFLGVLAGRQPSRRLSSPPHPP